MSVNYDNWERLVAAVVKREEIWQLCHQPSRTPSICSDSSDFSSVSVGGDESPDKGAAGAALPKVGDRDVSNPQLFRTYTEIFNRVPEERLMGVPQLFFLGGSAPGFHLKFTLKSSKELGKGTFGTSILTQLLQDVKVSDQEFLASGTELVMKKLWKAGVKLTEEKFKQQMKVFGNCRHENVAAPRAYCFYDDDNGMFILNDYHSQGSVSDMLHDNFRKFKHHRLGWGSRLKVAIGSARGIAHIHRQCGGKLAHGNIKSSNIFLNSQHYGCVSDFGLAGIMVNPRKWGALDYHASEYEFKTAPQESDVYSFGVLLLELLTGKSPMEPQGSRKNLHIVEWAHSIGPDEWTSKLFDKSLRRIITDEMDTAEILETEIPGGCLVVKQYATLQKLRAINRSHFQSMAIGMLQVAMRCLTMFPKSRPKMFEVVLMLEKIATLRDGQPQQTQNSHHTDEKERVWNRISVLGRSEVRDC